MPAPLPCPRPLHHSGAVGLTEPALKLKETCRIHAEAYSAAEVLHGPLSLAGTDLVVLGFGQGDETQASVEHALDTFAEAGSIVLATRATTKRGIALPNLPAHPLVGPILSIQSFYMLVARLSVSMGFDPDAPALLKKVTESL